ncbi:MAG: glycosyltransferase [Fibrobacteria bacterium]|nr:glycosyltransferase [Fibrobacteria bacterium]
MSTARKTILVIGHPLSTNENCGVFKTNQDVHYVLCAPKRWLVKSLGHTYVPANSRKDNFHTLPVIFSGRNSLFFWRGLSAFISSLRPSLIYCWEEPWCLSTLQVMRYASKQNIPFFFYSAENKEKKLPLLFSFFRRLIFKKASGAISITPEVDLQLEWAGYQGPIHRIPLWVSQHNYTPGNETKKNLLYIGRLIKLKRVSLIIQALTELPEFHLKIIGDGPERNNLAQLSKELNISNRVHFAGKIPNYNLHTHISDMGLAVIPTEENQRQAEQFGRAALEAVVMGLPVITSHTGNYINLSQRIETFYSFSFKDSSSLAHAITQLYQNYPHANILEQSRKFVLEHFSTATVSKKFNQLFVSI